MVTVGLDSVTVAAGLGAVISIRPAVLASRMSGLRCGLLQGSVLCCGSKSRAAFRCRLWAESVTFSPVYYL